MNKIFAKRGIGRATTDFRHCWWDTAKPIP